LDFPPFHETWKIKKKIIPGKSLEDEKLKTQTGS